jgi:hypothetical protein
MMEAGKIANGFYVQGEMKFAVDSSDAHKTFDAVEALSHADKLTLAKLNNIPTEPYNRQLLTNILKSVVQNAWFAAKHGNVPVEVANGHVTRLQRYHQDIATPTSAVDFLVKKRKESKTRPALLFTIDAAKYEADQANWRGQRYLVVKSMIELSKGDAAGVTIRAVFDNCAETRETVAPTRNAVGQIVNKLKEAGIVTCLNPQDAKKPAAPKTPATPPVAPKAVAPTSKKKH